MALRFTDNDPYVIGYGPCTADQQTETIDSLVASATVTSVTTFAGTSGRSLAFDMTTNGNKALVQATSISTLRSFQPVVAGGSSGIGVISFAAALSNAPTSEAGIFSGDTGNGGGSAPSARRYIRVGTDRKIYFYDRLGIQLGVTTSTVPIAGAMKRVTVSYDNLNNHASVWMKVYVDGVEELAFDAGTDWTGIFASDYGYWGEYLGAAVNRGCTLYLADAICRFSGTAAEAPHIAPYPDIKIVGGVTPDGDGSFTHWLAIPAGNRYTNVSANDGVTTVIQETVNGGKDTVKSSAANPMAVGSTVVKAQLRQVSNRGGVGKGTGDQMYGTVGAEVAVTTDTNFYAGTVGTTYTCRVCKKLFQDGVSVLPTYADANANASGWGAITAASGTVQDNLTYAPGPEWVHYTSLLPAGTGPPTSPAPDTSVVGTATYAGVT